MEYFSLYTTRALSSAEHHNSNINGTSATDIIVLAILLTLSASFSGLGLGLMSLDLVGLEIVVAAGEDENATEREQKNSAAARKIIPIRQRGNLLLTTLLLGNVSVNSLTSIIMADMTSGVYGFLISTILIVLLGEIVPQALCTKYALVIGGKVAPFVRLLICVFYVVAKPISLILDASLGDDIGTTFTKRQLREMIEIHQHQQMIDSEEGSILRGAMSYRSKTASDIMTPVNQVFMLPISFSLVDLYTTATLNHQVIQEILSSGYSRVPVWDNNANDIIGIIHVKDLLLIDPKEEVSLSSMIHIFARSAHRIDPTCDLHTLLEEFKQGRTHMALVKSISYEHAEGCFQLRGVVTLEDVLEEILQDEILDEGDIFDDSLIADKKHELSKRYMDSGRLCLSDISRPKDSFENFQALAEYLQASNLVFQSSAPTGRPLSIEDLVNLLSSSTVIDIGPNEKKKSILLEGSESHYCFIILEGNLLAESGGDQANEFGPWSVLAAESLIIPEGLFVPDFSLFTKPKVGVRLLQISRTNFQQKLHPFPRRTQ